MGKTEIIVNDNWKIVKMDSLNWQVHEKRLIGKPSKASSKSREGKVDWIGLPAFFCKPDLAARYVYDHIGDNEDKKMLREFIELMRSGRDEIVEAMGKSEAAKSPAAKSSKGK